MHNCLGAYGRIYCIRIHCLFKILTLCCLLAFACRSTSSRDFFSCFRFSRNSFFFHCEITSSDMYLWNKNEKNTFYKVNYTIVDDKWETKLKNKWYNIKGQNYGFPDECHIHLNLFQILSVLRSMFLIQL